MPDVPSDLEQRLSAGEAVLPELFQSIRPRLARALRLRIDARLRRRLDPSDILQETFIEAARRLPAYQAEAEPMPPFVWLRFLALQRLAGARRQHLGARCRDAGREGVAVDGLAVDADAMALELSASMTSPSQAVSRAEQQRLLLTVLDRLEPAEREILCLRQLEEMGNAEAAQSLGISSAAASKRFMRALERLQGLLLGTPGLVGALGP